VIRGWNKDSTFASEGISRQLERFGVMASDLDRAPSISAIWIRIPASFFSHTETARILWDVRGADFSFAMQTFTDIDNALE